MRDAHDAFHAAVDHRSQPVFAAERVGFEPTVLVPQLFRARPFGPARVPSSPDVGLGAVLARARPDGPARELARGRLRATWGRPALLGGVKARKARRWRAVFRRTQRLGLAARPSAMFFARALATGDAVPDCWAPDSDGTEITQPGRTWYRHRRLCRRRLAISSISGAGRRRGRSTKSCARIC
jgi:hypothetical protein